MKASVQNRIIVDISLLPAMDITNIVLIIVSIKLFRLSKFPSKHINKIQGKVYAAYPENQ